MLQNKPMIPKRKQTEQPLQLETAWAEVSPAEGNDLIQNGQSLLVLGLAGTGKSHYCLELVESLRNCGKRVENTYHQKSARGLQGGVQLAEAAVVGRR